MKLSNLLVVSLMAGLFSGGCKRVEPPSPIVKKIQDAGAGDVTNASKESIQQWFRQHRDLAKEIGQDWNRVESTKPADWGDTTEGRVCQAAASVAVIGNEHIQTDQQKF